MTNRLGQPRINSDDLYGVFIPSSNKPLMTNNDLRAFEVFISEGRKRIIYNMKTMIPYKGQCNYWLI